MHVLLFFLRKSGNSLIDAVRLSRTSQAELQKSYLFPIIGDKDLLINFLK